jgi:superfamily II DNA or RNA helicase
LIHERIVRLITTVYTGSTERKALDWLIGLGAAVKVSYDTESTRLHAKAWRFQRESGYSTVYIGSSNLTKSALLDGVEWNVRLSEVTSLDILRKFQAAFDSYWSNPDYEAYDSVRDRDRLDAALSRGKGDSAQPFDPALVFFDVHPHQFQQEMLERLSVERARHDRHRNLVVAATGTGKTVVAALDFKGLRTKLGDPTLLFVAHRREILTQALGTFRQVFRNNTFGELYVDGQKPEAGRHVFASVQSLARLDLREIDPAFFDVVIVDEFHHATADTYARLLNHIRPTELVGLTATPERADGESVLAYFDDHISVELRLWDALERDLLCPFQYFGLNDQTDLTTLRWSRKG